MTLQSLPNIDRFELIASRIVLVSTDYFSLSEYDCEAILSEFESFNIYDNLNPESQIQFRDFHVKINLYNELIKYFEEGFYYQTNTQVFANRGIQIIQNLDIFNYYGSLFRVPLRLLFRYVY